MRPESHLISRPKAAPDRAASAMQPSEERRCLGEFLKVVGVTTQWEIERIVREGKIEGTKLKLRMTLTAENTPLNQVVEEAIDLR
jgi:metal-sulfur cluster biosynthetic enzyme